MQSMNRPTTTQNPPCEQDDRLNHVRRIETLYRKLEQIQEASSMLDAVVMTQEEENEAQQAVEHYKSEMLDMLLETRMHLQLYRESGWREMIYGEEQD